MFDQTSLDTIRDIFANSHHIVLMQADNPDADSLGSALALESIFGDEGKQTSLYCAVDMPGYLHYLTGWDRVTKELPASFDAVVLVDASVRSLVARLEDASFQGILKSKPMIILDHHQSVQDTIDFARVTINRPELSSSGELIYSLSRELGWRVSIDAGVNVMAAILGDTQGLSNDLTSSGTYRTMAELLDAGVNRALLEESRKEFSKMPESIFRYKATLIQRTELYDDGAVAIVSVPQQEINTYSPLYNPSALVQFDTLQTVGVQVSVVFKMYDSGRITAAIRSNANAPVAGDLAKHFGGGGHDFASGFKLEDGRPFNEIKSECIAYASELLSNIKQDKKDEAIQHTF